MLGEPQERDDLSLVMDEFKSMLQSWGRHVLEDLRREIPQGSVDSTQVQRKVSENFLGSVFCLRRFQEALFSTFRFNKEHLRRQHLGSMCSLQSCYRQKEFFLFMVNPQLLSQHGFIATKSSVLMVRGSS